MLLNILYVCVTCVARCVLLDIFYVCMYLLSYVLLDMLYEFIIIYVLLNMLYVFTVCVAQYVLCVYTS